MIGSEFVNLCGQEEKNVSFNDIAANHCKTLFSIYDDLPKNLAIILLEVVNDRTSPLVFTLFPYSCQLLR